MKDKQEQLAQLAQLVAALAKNTQKATYTAVAGLVGLPARTVMNALLKDPQGEWVVAKQSHQPTGYSTNQLRPQLKSNSSVIASTAVLASWWEKHPL
jgi:alkylated DNA nucleotide flippase Atl1